MLDQVEVYTVSTFTLFIRELRPVCRAHAQIAHHGMCAAAHMCIVQNLIHGAHYYMGGLMLMGTWADRAQRPERMGMDGWRRQIHRCEAREAEKKTSITI